MTTSTPTKRARLLTAQELELVEQLQKALIGKATSEATLGVCRREIGRVTQEINKLNFDDEGKAKGGLLRSIVVWAEVRDLIGAPPAPTRAQLIKGT